ncbi:MAG: hypothetical protein MI922_22510 [Bacteroidales bacterium]|nr:hypothetical protein [Bacteroidales bacterium]
MSDRKNDHLHLVSQSQTLVPENDTRFIYEPLLKSHPRGDFAPFKFLKKQIKTPIWASSMTGGTKMAKTINHNIARVCKDFGMGMGLGSCRVLLDDDTYLEDFDVRSVIGDKLPLYANLGIAQLEQLIAKNKIEAIEKLLEKLRADGLIIHINPMQEWFQPEGNTITQPPIVTIERLIDKVKYPVIVKEVGQGMGVESLRSLLQLPLAAIEFGAFGGTNFSILEMYRADEKILDAYKPFAFVGQTAEEMVRDINGLLKSIDVRCTEVIISGGIKSFLDGYYYMEKCKLNSVYGMASAILKHAKVGYDELFQFIESQIEGLKMARNFLRVEDS